MCHYFRISKSFILERAVTIFCRIFFCLAVSKISYGGSSVFHKISGIENFYGKEGEEEEGGRKYQNFPSKLFVSVPKKFVGNTLVCH